MKSNHVRTCTHCDQILLLPFFNWQLVGEELYGIMQIFFRHFFLCHSPIFYYIFFYQNQHLLYHTLIPISEK